MAARHAMPAVHAYALGREGPEPLPLPADVAGVHGVLDALDLPDAGVYTGLRTFGGVEFLGAEEHLDRMQDCIAALGWRERLGRDLLRRGLQQVAELERAERPESFLRLDVLAPEAGIAPGGQRILVSTEPLRRVPPELVEDGVRVEVAEGLHRRDPLIKRAEFVRRRRPYPLATREAYEHLLVDDAGAILEGTSSNVYAVVGDRLRTAGREVLLGVTRRFVLFLCGGLELAIHMEPVRLDELGAVDELFLSSSTRGVVPIVSVAGRTIGRGVPGPVTRRLVEGYDRLAARYARPAWPVRDAAPQGAARG